MKKTWRCFFCDVVLRSERAAREHFGASEMSTPACQIKGHEHGLVELIRRQEEELARYRAEDSELLRTWRQRESEHAQALLREEEKGYARGIDDMRARGWSAEGRIHGVTWVLIRDGRVALERCEKKARVLGVGEWFIPGGKLEGDETTDEALRREFAEEWPTMKLSNFWPLPIVEGSPVPPGPRGLFLMRPYLVTAVGELPPTAAEGTPLRLAPVAEALASPVLQVRMMTAAALVNR